jgi:phospholipase/carboxylesterase
MDENTIFLPSRKPAIGNIVILHGWGATNEDLLPLTDYFQLPQYNFIYPQGIFPHPYTDDGRMWYSFTGVGQFTDHSRQEMAESRDFLRQVIADIAASNGMGFDRTYLGGFSQGGAMSLEIGLTLPLAGLMVFSGYLHPTIDRPLGEKVPPVLIVHGTDDDVVPLAAAVTTHRQLRDWGANVEYCEFEMGHTIVPQVLATARKWISRHEINP